MTREAGLSDSESFLSGGGELGQLMRRFDWGGNPLGPPGEWPRSLKTAVRIMLTSRQPIWIGWGRELIYLYNDPYKAIIGGKHPQALGQPTRAVWGEIWDDIGPLLDKAMQGDEGTYVESQLLVMERNGYPEETYYTFSYSPIPDDEGNVGGIICANTDVTQRVIGERQLAVLRDLAAGTAHARTWQEACRQSGRSLGLDPQDLPFALIYILDAEGMGAELAGHSGIAVGHAAAPERIDLKQGTAWPLGKVLESQSLVVVEDLGERFPEGLPCGAWKRPPSRAVMAPIPSIGQTGRGGVLVAGLNPFRLLDEGYRNFLTLAAGQISSSITNAQAYEEEKKRAESLAELDRAKTTFFSNVSHEFRTPLTLMLGPLHDTLNQAHGEIPEEARQELAVVHRNGLRLLKLVNTLLDFSRIEAGRVQAVYEPVDLAVYTAELASVFRSAIEKAGLAFHVECSALREPIYVDRSMWEKIVLNLLSNAFKFTLAGSIGVTLRETEGEAVLVVRDTGSGIPAHELPRLFERFHRAEGTKGRAHEGTGIGLALVQELVRLHQGRVEVESRVNEGSVFTVRIPRGRNHLPAERIHAAGSAAPASLSAEVFLEEARRWLPETRGDGHAGLGVEPAAAAGKGDGSGRARIVLADDNADMRQYVQRLLSSDYDVEAVNDGALAIEAVRRRLPSLVVSDVMMPNLDGFGLIRELRENPATSHVPVLLLSARAGEEATLEGLQAGADDYLVKPFSARELMGRVAALLERKRFQRALAAADERLRIALSAAKMAAWEWNPAADRVVLSDTAAAVFGLPPGRTLESSREGLTLLHPEDVEEHRKRLEEAVQALSSFHTQFRIIRPVDGAVAWLEERGIARRNEVTGEVHVTGVVMDVSEAKRAEQEREELLERERAARGEAERASRLKDEFLATLSHELRTPLNAILGWSEILERQGRKDPETLAQGLTVIARNAKSQAQLIEDLLDMSRITSGKLRLDVQRVDMAEVIGAAVESVRPAAEAREIVLTKVVDSVRSIVSGDPHRLQQVVWNLLSNAIKFTPKGGRVRVVLEQANSQVQLRVSDSGKGISRDFLPYVFERFRQADASTTRAFGGLGLGLAIVKQLVELHGGTVQAESEGEGRGATFVVELPLAVAHGDAGASEPAVREMKSGLGDVSLTGLNVLIVDDEPDARNLVQRILEQCGAAVTAAGSAAEALSLLPTEKPDVIVSDIGMPGQDGYEFIRVVRSLPIAAGGSTPAAALTAYARSQDRRQALMAGYQSHIVKPADPAELVAVVASLAGRFNKG